MDINLLVGIISLALSIGFFGYGLYMTRKSRLQKLLVFDVSPPVPIADVIKGQGDYKLQVVYQEGNESPRFVEKAFIRYLRFANLGRIPIKKEDIASTDPLLVHVADAELLGISLSHVTRDVPGIRLGEIRHEDQQTVVTVYFEFLDYQDGAMVQIVTESDKYQASLIGTVIGMPRGIKKAKEVPYSQHITGLGCIVPLSIQVAALTSAPFLYRYITGSWEYAWTLLLPIAAIAVPFALFLAALFMSGPREEFKFPDSLFPPDWFAKRLHMYRELDRFAR